jgi:hypothetical protein
MCDDYFCGSESRASSLRLARAAASAYSPAPLTLLRCFLRIHSLFASCTSNAGSPVSQSLMAASPATAGARLRDYPGHGVLMTLALHPLAGALKNLCC